MAGIRSTNNAARRSRARRVIQEARVFHETRVRRLTLSGTLHKLKDSGYCRRQRARAAAIRAARAAA